MSFFDHFPGAALDARWTSVTAGSGAVTVTDSYARLNSSGADTDAAFIYYGTKLDKTKSQLWMVCLSITSFSHSPLHIINKATAPVAEAFDGAWSPRMVMRVNCAFGNAFTLERWTSGNVQQRWQPGSSTWATTATASITPAAAGDFYIFGFEFDADNGNSRWRMFAAHQTVASGYTVNQGLRIFALTDWTNWSDTRAHGDGLWLVIGDPLNEFWSSDTKVEWVRHGDDARQYMYTNAKDAFSGNYGLRTSWGYDGKFFVPKDRTTVDVADAKDPWCVYDGSTYHLFYRTMGTSPEAEIRRATSSSPEGPWTEQNTLASPGTDHEFWFPHVLYTPWETSGREWQCVYADVNFSNNIVQLRLLTASTPGGTWTDQGVILSEGGVGDDDEQGYGAGVPIHRNGRYEIWGTPKGVVSGVDFVHMTGSLAYGPALDNLTKDGLPARIPPQDAVELIDADLNGNSITLSDTTGFEADQLVYLNQDNNADNWSGSRIRKVTSNTSLELYHAIKGFTTANGAKVLAGSAGNQQISDMVKVGDEWWVFIVIFNHARLEPTFTSFQEEQALLIVPSGQDLEDMDPSMYSWIDSPVVMRGSWSNIRSNENSTLIHPATVQTFSGILPQMLHHHGG